METERDLRYYGWRVVLAANLGVMVGFSLYAYTFSVFMKPLSARFGWNREAISVGFAISALTAAVCSPLAGRWLDRNGPRHPLLACLALYGCSLVALSFLQQAIWQFYLTCFVSEPWAISYRWAMLTPSRLGSPVTVGRPWALCWQARASASGSFRC